MNELAQLRATLQQVINPAPAKGIYFKTGPGGYAEHDQFIGVSVPELRKIAKQYRVLSLPQLQQLIASAINEERLLALLILVGRYQTEDKQTQLQVYQFYLQNLPHINNWNLVDASAHLIVGAQLFNNKDHTLLTMLAHSESMWERRIAIVATWYFIRQNQFKPTLHLAELLLSDPQDLIHKAVGWMLREAGKRDQSVLEAFLGKHAHRMPRTMLRYAIERFPAPVRQVYLVAKAERKNELI